MKNCGKHIDISNMKKDENIKGNVWQFRKDI